MALVNPAFLMRRLTLQRIHGAPTLIHGALNRPPAVQVWVPSPHRSQHRYPSPLPPPQTEMFSPWGRELACQDFAICMRRRSKLIADSDTEIRHDAEREARQTLRRERERQTEARERERQTEADSGREIYVTEAGSFVCRTATRIYVPKRSRNAVSQVQSEGGTADELGDENRASIDAVAGPSTLQVRRKTERTGHGSREPSFSEEGEETDSSENSWSAHSKAAHLQFKSGFRVPIALNIAIHPLFLLLKQRCFPLGGGNLHARTLRFACGGGRN